VKSGNFILGFVIEEKFLKEMVSIIEKLRYFGSWQIKSYIYCL